jgi:probable addiction module antidote protein
MAVEFEPFDISEHLDSEKMIAGYLSAAAEDEDPNVLLGALLHAAKAQGMMQVARAAGLNRESLYKALKPGAHPRFETVQAVLRALGVKLAMTPGSNLGAGAGDARAEHPLAELPRLVEFSHLGISDGEGGRRGAGAKKAGKITKAVSALERVSIEALRPIVEPGAVRAHGQTGKAAKTAAHAKSAGKTRTAARLKERASSGETRAHRR